MTVRPGPLLDARTVDGFLADLLARRPGYVPEWLPSAAGPDAALVQILARYLQTITQRLNQAPDKNGLAFLDVLGIELLRPQAARAPIVFRLADKAPDARLPAGTRVAAPPPPERNDQIIFETERATGLAAAHLVEVVSLWPGRDQYIDHSAAYQDGQPMRPFRKTDLRDTPHVLYLAHDTLLALAGESAVDVGVELTTVGSAPLDIVWEYWDGTVWREFLSMRADCDHEAARKIDGTVGLTRPGKFHLETACAETARTKVDGIEAYWIRGRLTEPLPPDPARALPEVDIIKLSTEIRRPLILTWTASRRSTIVTTDPEDPNLVVRARDDTGVPLRGIQVRAEPTTTLDPPIATDLDGTLELDVPDGTVTVTLPDFEDSGEFTGETFPVESGLRVELQLTLASAGLAPDKAFADALPLDLGKPFFPLGMQPQPGAAFYFTSGEVFARPGARVRLYLQTAQTPQDQLSPPSSPPIIGIAGGRGSPDATPLQHTLRWEYWNGREWTALPHAGHPALDTTPSPEAFTGTGIVEFTMPLDLAPTKVGGQDGLWMRVRLLSGGFGIRRTTTLNDGTTFVYVVNQPPALSRLLLGYTWQHGPFHAEHVLSHNDFRYEDRTEAAKWPGTTFQPFTPVRDATPGLYLGFDQKLPVDRLGVFFDVVEVRGDTAGPALRWQYWDGVTWKDILVEDETRNLRLPGLVALIGPRDSEPLARFEAPRHWLRTRLKEDGPPGEPTLTGIFPNAVWATQQQTIADEPLGASTGEPSQVFAFRQAPVLPGESIDVRELAGLRANVEWRILARELFGADGRVIRELETLLGAEGSSTTIERGVLRLIRDRAKRVIEAWVRWESRRNLFSSGPLDRHYVPDGPNGQLMFGDSEHGRIPPLGAALVARQYRTGGGFAGNVGARLITQVLGPIGGVEEAFNPRPAEGGADGETLQALAARGPASVRHRGRALAAADYETLAREANASVAVAHAIACRDDGGRLAPGWVTLVIIPRSLDARPWPSFGLREAVQRFVAQRASADVAAAAHIYVTGPDYTTVDVEAKLVPVDPAEAGAVEQRAVAALGAFLHPLRGGPDGEGWAPGQNVFLSNVASVLERVEGLDHVDELALFIDGARQGDPASIPAHRIVAAGEFRLKLSEGQP